MWWELSAYYGIVAGNIALLPCLVLDRYPVLVVARHKLHHVLLLHCQLCAQRTVGVCLILVLHHQLLTRPPFTHLCNSRYNRALDKVHIFISVMPISSPNHIFDHLLQSSHWVDSIKWSRIGFGEEVRQAVSIEVNLHILSGVLGTSRTISPWLYKITMY